MPKSLGKLIVVIAMLSGGCAEHPLGGGSLQVASSREPGIPVFDGAAASPPPGFVGFCIHAPAACTNHGPAQAVVPVDAQLEARLVAVNDKINRAIIFESDERQFGVANRWTLEPADGGYGDCKDYALAKREALRAAGLPDSALRIAIVRTRQNQLHAVLTVDTDKGVLVLDSRTSQIMPVSETSYDWLERQASDSPLHWVAMSDAEAAGPNDSWSD